MFLVATDKDRIVGNIMGGYDGHRGWVSYLSVSPTVRLKGIGKALVNSLERRLTELGCPKLNLQIRTSNTSVIKFYAAIGYKEDPVISMGKRLIPDE